MKTIEFVKGQATGNDFIVVSDPNGSSPMTPEQVARMCDRRFGVGADGLIRAVRSETLAEGRALLEEEPRAEWFMDYYNADGSQSELCGNGIRVFVHYLVSEGYISIEDRRDVIAIGTRAGVRDVIVGVAGYSVDLGRWRLDENRIVNAKHLEVGRPGLGLNLGNPHVVVAVQNDAELDAIDLGAPPELDPAPPEGVNVEFVHPQEPLIKDGVAQVRMRVHERGSGETLSCGTGAAAAALAFRHWGGDEMPNSWRVEVPGGVLGVRMFATEEGEHISISGPAELVYRGRIDLSAGYDTPRTTRMT